MRKYSGRGRPPNQTIVNAFIISRVPAGFPIDYAALNGNLSKDIEQAKEKGFDFLKHSRRATPSCMLRFLIDRGLLSQTGGDAGKVIRNERSDAYMRKIPKRVMNIIDKLPMSDPLVLLAGSSG